MKIKDYIIIFLLVIVLIFSFLNYKNFGDFYKKNNGEIDKKIILQEIEKKDSETSSQGQKNNIENKEKNLEQEKENLEEKKIEGKNKDFDKNLEGQNKKNNIKNFDKKFQFQKEKNNSQNKEKIKDFCKQFIDKKRYYKVWSKTNPKINKTHIFCGEINSRKKASGFHSRPYGIDPATAKIIEKKDINKIGVYTAKVGVLDIKKNIYKEKFSSLFPDNLSYSDVEKIIINAWKNKKFYKHSKFRGPSGLGFQIEGYILDGKINTAYPIYENK